MGTATSTVDKTPTTVPANQYSLAITSDLTLQDLYDTVVQLAQNAAGSGESNMRRVSLSLTIITDMSNKQTGLTVTAAWVGA